MNQPADTVFVVDDDSAVRGSVRMLLKSVSIPTECFESGDAFLAAYKPEWKGCILLDIRMPGTSGMEVQKELKKISCTLPVIFVTGHGDVSMAVEAMHSGAFDFLQKPYRDQELLERINQALSARQEAEQAGDQARRAQGHYDSLTPREKEVMACVVKGLANKVIAMDLDVSQRTVEIHRARVMEKMQARSLAELVRTAMLLKF